MIKYTELKNENRKVLKDIIPLNKPFTVLIEPSSLCNFKCTQCFQSITDETFFSKNKKNMELDLYNKIINDIKNWDGEKIKVLKLSLFGEPFVNPNFCEMLKTAKDANIAERIETTSNVSLLTEEICEKLVDYGLDYLRMSIYSPTQENHKRITNNDIDINIIHANLEMLQKVKSRKNSKTPFVAVKMLDTYSDENQVFLDMYGDVSDELFIDTPHNWIAHDEKNFIESLYENNSKVAFDSLEKQKDDKIACSMAFFTLAIRSNGDINPCCVDWLNNTKIDNVNTKNLQDIWKSKEMIEFWKMQLENKRNTNESCKNCEMSNSQYYVRDNIDGFPVEKLKFE